MRRIKRFSSKHSELLFRTVAILLPLISAVLLLSQTVFAQNTYVITDGERVLVHTTSTTDPAAVLDEAGLALGEEDTYTTQGGDGVSEITVRRYQTVTIDHCGQELTVDAHTETVKNLLTRLDIVLDENTTVSAPLDELTYDGMHLTIARTIQTTQTYSKLIPFETTYCDDATLPTGTRVILNKGEAGEMICTAEVTYRNGQQTSSTIIRQLLNKHPITQVVAVGTGPREVTSVEEVAVTEAEPAWENEAPSAESEWEDESIWEEEPEEETYPEAVDPAPDYPVIGGGTITTASGEVLTYTHTMVVEATAYTKTDEGCGDYTATLTLARYGAIAVDPDVIPYGTRMYIVSNDGEYIYGIATAEDCGGAINGYRIDLYYDTTAECFQFGRRDCTIYFLG